MKFLLRPLAALVCVVCLVMAVATFPLGDMQLRALVRPAVCLILGAGAGYLAVTGRSFRFQ
jgi:hypothetical protein